jgi:hypothetical protein
MRYYPIIRSRPARVTRSPSPSLPPESPLAVRISVVKGRNASRMRAHAVDGGDVATLRHLGGEGAVVFGRFGRSSISVPLHRYPIFPPAPLEATLQPLN